MGQEAQLLRIAAAVCLVTALAGAQERPTGAGVNFYSLEKEVALGKQLAAEFQRNSKPLDSPAVLAYVNDIGQRLAAQTGGPPFTYTFSLVADDQTALHEAAAFPGGFLFVPASLILAAKDEDEFAGMLAHAIAHVAARDGTRLATRTELMNQTAIPLIYMGGWGGQATRQGAALSAPINLLQMQRKLELAADRLAAAKMAAAGYDPEALARYVDREQASYDENSTPTFSPLPARAKRVETIREAIGGIPAQAYPPHEGFGRIQEETRRLTAAGPPKAPPTLGK